jgi:hypothetical protein
MDKEKSALLSGGGMSLTLNWPIRLNVLSGKNKLTTKWNLHFVKKKVAN